MNATTVKEYVLNLETSKIELRFTKEEYQSLNFDQKKMLKSSYLFSGTQKAWISRSKNNHYSAIATAEKLGFSNGGKIGERLSYAEKIEREAEKAEERAERFENYSQNAHQRGKQLQSEFNENRKDIAWLTQPNINSSSGRSFTNQRNRVMARFEKGMDEYRKSEYYQERAERARSTADQTKLKNKTYLNNRIEETNATIRKIQAAIVNAENANKTERVNELVDKMEYQIDKLAFLQNCMDEIGGVQYNKDNVKKGYFVKIRGSWEEVVKTNPKTVQTKSNFCSLQLKYPYAEIRDLKIPEGWKEEKEIVLNPFNVNDIVTFDNIAGDRIIKAFQAVKVTAKSVTIQQIKVIDNKPQLNDFVNSLQERKTAKKDRSGNNVLNYGDWYLYQYKTN